MTTSWTRTASCLALVSLLGAGWPAGAAAPPGLGRIEGYLLAIDGRAAAGHTVHLIDERGHDLAQSQTSTEGVYRLRDVPAGAYSLGVESPEGRVAPVAAPPLRLAAGALERRDIKLVEATGADRERVGLENRSFGTWWAGLSPGTKAGAVLGTFVILGLALASLDDDEEEGTEADGD